MHPLSRWHTTGLEFGPGCQDMSEHKDVQKFLQSPPGCYSNFVSFNALGVHFQHQMVRRFQLLSFQKTVFICKQQIKPGAWCESPLFLLQITSAIRSDVPSQIYCPKSSQVPIDAFSIFTSMSLSNMWASGRKEMRQSSWFGKITFCKKVI